MKQPFTLVMPFIFSIFFLGSFAAPRNPLSTDIQSNSSDIKMLSTWLIAANGNMADGNRVVFDPQYSNSVDGNDAVKMLNISENFGLSRTSQILAVEARQPIAAGDTLFYQMSNLFPQVYKLLIVPQYLSEPDVKCELIDRYLNTRAPINLNDTNRFSMAITSDPASRMANRLFVVFSASRELPLKFTQIAVTKKVNENIALSWHVEQELNIDRYDVEKSADDINFSNVYTVLPQYNNQQGGGYLFTEVSVPLPTSFYRIRSINKQGESTYSATVKFTLPGIKTSMKLYPNPVVNHNLLLQLFQVAPGNYQVKILNQQGQPVYTNTLRVTGTDLTQAISLSNTISKGIYSLAISNETGIIISQPLIIP